MRPLCKISQISQYDAPLWGIGGIVGVIVLVSGIVAVGVIVRVRVTVGVSVIVGSSVGDKVGEGELVCVGGMRVFVGVLEGIIVGVIVKVIVGVNVGAIVGGAGGNTFVGLQRMIARTKTTNKNKTINATRTLRLFILKPFQLLTRYLIIYLGTSEVS